MKLHTKLLISLVGCVVVLVGAALVIQYFITAGMINEFSENSIATLTQREEANALNIHNSVENSVSGSLKRGEMEKFTKLLKDQESIKGFEEFSLFDLHGKLTHSSTTENMYKVVPEDVRARISEKPEMVLNWQDKAVEIYQPQMIEPDCIRCHIDWIEGGVGGFTYFRFSTEELAEARVVASAAQGRILSATFIISIVMLLGIITALVIVVYLMMNRLVKKPLDKFVHYLHEFEKDEGDLTKQIRIESRDEIGALAELFNNLIGKMNIAIGRAQGAAITVSQEANSQASILQETSSTVTQIASNATQSAANAGQADNLMKDIANVIGEAALSVDRLIQSMEDLNETSKRTASIIKTIEEVAFQTKLLALNASVEAARAGEAGKGFAVVATEVQNLANRAKVAADDTTVQLKETVRKIDESSDIVNKFGEVFSVVKDNSSEAKELVTRISSASSENASGTDMLQKTLTDLGSTAQKNSGQAGQLAETMSVFKTDNGKKTLSLPGHNG